MTKNDYEKVYWKQYLLIEAEFIETIKYVELDEDNFSTFSIVFVKLLLQIGSEVDNVLRYMSNHTGRSDISKYAEFIMNKFPEMVNQCVTVNKYQVSVAPFEGWNSEQASKSLLFWNAYNEVKHDRILNYKKANLEIVLNGLAALFVLNIFALFEIYKADENIFESTPDVQSELFVLQGWINHIRSSKVKLENKLMDDDDGSIIG